MLMRSEPFTEVNRLAQQLFGAPQTGTWSRPSAMPADSYRNGDEFVVAFDLPGVDRDSIDIDVERNVLTVRAERRPVDLGDQAVAQLCERPPGCSPGRCSSAMPSTPSTLTLPTTTVCWSCGSRSRSGPSPAR